MRNIFRTIWRVLTLPFRLIFGIFRTISRWIRSIFSEISSLLTEEVDDKPLADTVTDVIENPMGLLEHLDALRKHLFRGVVFMAITTSFSFAYTPRLIDLLAEPIGGINALTAIEVTEPVGVFMRVALLVGFALALPYLAFEAWLFAAPGLYLRSRFIGLISIPLIFLFFIAGMSFAYFVMLPTALPFLLNFMGLNTQVRPDSYIKFVTGLMFWIGVAFEFPLVIYVLAAMRIIKARLLAEQWRLAIVLIAVMSAAITPTVDPVNMSLVMAPMISLYFLSIALAYLAQRGDRQTATQET